MQSKRIQIDGYDTDYIAYENGVIINDRTNQQVPYMHGSVKRLADLSRSGVNVSDAFPWVELWFRREIHKIYVKDLIAELFLPNPNGYTYVRYIDKSNYLDCSVSNLAWARPKRHVNFMVLTDEQAHEVCRMLEEGILSHKEIADKMGIDKQIVSRIVNFGTYEEIARQYNFKRKDIDIYYYGCEWTLELRDKIDACIERGMKTQEICDELGIPNTYRINEKIRIRRRCRRNRLARKAAKELKKKQSNE